MGAGAKAHTTEEIDMQWIPNATQVLLHAYSTRAQAVALALVGGYQLMPDKMQDALPASVVMLVACVVLALGMVGRLIEQPALHPEDDA
jgi:hypothetical protein